MDGRDDPAHPLGGAGGERESEVVPDVFPAYQGLMVGDDGVLWVQDYIRPGQREAEWFAFDSDGTWIRTLVLPPRAVLLDIGPDWALVRTLDDLDVQRVAVPPYARGGSVVRSDWPSALVEVARL